MFKTNPF